VFEGVRLETRGIGFMLTRVRQWGRTGFDEGEEALGCVSVGPGTTQILLGNTTANDNGIALAA
jgi:hypothetical protein